MTWDPALDRLQAILANLYSRNADVRRVAASAGLDAAFIDFDGPAIDVWHQVLGDALHRNRVADVIAVAQREYPDNAELAAAAEAVRASAPIGGKGSSAPSPTPATGTRSLLTSRAWLAIGAGVLVVAIVAVLALRPPATAPGPTVAGTPGPTVSALALASEAVPPTATATVPPPTWTPAPTATWAPAQPTPFPAVTFVTRFVIDQAEQLVPMEYNYESGVLPSETITDFLSLKRIEWGTLIEAQGEVPALSFTLAVKNTGSQPMALDLDQRFYRLVDDKGRTGELAFFCCATRDEFLEPDRVREIVLTYRSNKAWGGKGGASQALLEVHGLLPVLSATWRVPLAVTAD